MKVLLLEDDPDVYETIISVLESFFTGVEVEHFVDGAGFRSGNWQKGGWSLVILDLMMPGITGFEICEQLRAYPSTQKTPILALTGYDTLQNEEKIKACGATGYMAKPFEVRKLKDEIERLIKNGI
ncbi:MAG: response regulator [Elusimicrobiota bacterium]